MTLVTTKRLGKAVGRKRRRPRGSSEGLSGQCFTGEKAGRQIPPAGPGTEGRAGSRCLPGPIEHMFSGKLGQMCPPSASSRRLPPWCFLVSPWFRPGNSSSSLRSLMARPCGCRLGNQCFVGVFFGFLLQAEQSEEEQKQGLNAEKLMRQVSKDVCRLREQSRKVPRQVQSFR